MASTTETADAIDLTKPQLEWLLHALANVQLRSMDERAAHFAVSSQVARLAATNLQRVILSLKPLEVMVVLWAVQEGKVRDGGERLRRGELQQLFERVNGAKGASGI